MCCPVVESNIIFCTFCLFIYLFIIFIRRLGLRICGMWLFILMCFVSILTTDTVAESTSAVFNFFLFINIDLVTFFF